MKIRTKIIWVSCIAILAAVLIGDAVIWVLARKSFMNEALVSAYQNSYVAVENLKQDANFDSPLLMDETFLSYYFKSQEDDYNICIHTMGKDDSSSPYFEEIYNHTVIDAKTLWNMPYHEYESMKYAYLDREGRNYIVFSTELSPEWHYYRIEDISYVWDRMEWLAACMLAITLIVTALTVCTLSIILRRMLKPLQELRDTTRNIAQGLYNQRVHIRHADEIGQLGENFNRMAEAVEARTHSLEESEKKKTLFMGNLTHELKTPMTAISGYAQTLLSTKLSEEQQQEALMYIYEECARLERLSRKMMKLLELDQEAELELTNTKVLSIFEAAKKSCTAILRDKQITLEFSEHGETFPMEADLMTDVLINLIDNAVKASPQGGRILLKAYGQCIEVQDFGQGIPADEQENILEPFYMIDKSRSRGNGGAGLGLALTAAIARRHNISLYIESEPDEGTRMILQFV